MKNFDDYTCRKLETKEEFYQLIQINREEFDWNPFETDYVTDRHYDDFNNIRIYSYKGEDFMVYSFLDYKLSKSIYFGNFICQKNFRNKGHSFPLFKKEYDDLIRKGYNFYLVSSDLTQLYIDKLKMNNYFCILGMIGRVEKIQKSVLDSHLVFENLDLEKIAEYDLQIGQMDRKKVLKSYLEIPEIIKVTFQENGIVRGYGVARPAKKQMVVGPLYADSQEIATEIINGIVSKSNPLMRIMVIMPETNKTNGMIKYLNKIGYDDEVKHYNILGTAKPVADFDKVYSIFSWTYGF